MSNSCPRSSRSSGSRSSGSDFPDWACSFARTSRATPPPPFGPSLMRPPLALWFAGERALGGASRLMMSRVKKSAASSWRCGAATAATAATATATAFAGRQAIGRPAGQPALVRARVCKLATNFSSPAPSRAALLAEMASFASQLTRPVIIQRSRQIHWALPVWRAEPHSVSAPRFAGPEALRGP